ncbi:MAG: adenylate/guanylate cyclase domain-containing protein [Chitinophagaceae bacterium]
MALINLKSILNKRSAVYSLLGVVSRQMNLSIQVTDISGTILFGENELKADVEFSIQADDETLGFVKGNADAKVIADLLNTLVQKEDDKKKLGKEVLNLYKEINLVFNFSEKLAQAIDPVSIAQTALEEAGHIIHSDGGVVILWNEITRQLEPVAHSGNVFFNLEKVNARADLLLKIVLSGQSEITSDISSLKEAEIIIEDVDSIVYGALKVNHRVLGAIILADCQKGQYSAADLKLLTTLALQSSSAIESAMLYEKNIREAREKEEAMRRIYEITGRFVPFEFIRSLGHERITEVRLGDSVERIVTVLFSDIREYTTLAEQMTPQENFNFVRSFNEMIGPVIRDNHGFINQYLGDAIMAIFPGNASDALKAAIEMHQLMHEFNHKRKAENKRPVQIGIGMHTGPLIMGIIGDEQRLDAATLSDTVNTASRLESLTKYYKAGILISDDALQHISVAGSFHLRYLGRVQLKGKQSAIGVHECFNANLPAEVELKLTSLSLFNDGVQLYTGRSFDKASDAFRQITESNPTDLTAKLFLNNASRYLDSGVPDNWAGVEEMLIK